MEQTHSTPSVVPTSERIRIRRLVAGHVLVTCTIRSKHFTVIWTAKTFTSSIPTGVAEARRGARKALSEMFAAT